MTLLEILFGTRTKIKIIAALVRSKNPRSRHELVKECGSTQGVYEQVEELIGVGALKEEGGRISLNPEFPLYDDVSNLFVMGEIYLRDLKSVLDRIGELLGDEYYVGGFLAARQSIVPIDYDTDAVMLNVLGLDDRIKRRLHALSRASGFRLIVKPAERIPEDVVKQSIYGSDIWIAGVERGVVEALAGNDCTTYGAYLVLLQNLSEGALLKEKLLEVAHEYAMESEVLSILNAINCEAGRDLVPLSGDEKMKAKRLANITEIRNAINTVFG